jgi:proteic killer suppression protein
LIRSFKRKETEALFHDEDIPRFRSFERAARRKLHMLNSVSRLESLRVPPGNRLEALSGSRRGQFSIRINEQWRVCFRWNDGDVVGVEIVDYH